MLLPMPAMPAPSGFGPSEYAKQRSPIFCALLTFQTVVCVLRMVMLLDIMGGFIMAICIGLGWYAWRESMHITFICYYGMMGLINGALDLVKFIDSWVKSPAPLFSRQLPLEYNFASLIMLMIPLSMLAGAYFAYDMYCKESEDNSGVYRSGGGGRAYGSQASAPAGRTASSTKSFSAFGGSGQRLGAV
eukprot:TRINITY_DN18970_c0_g1_i2.p2 TRINITY_DN18970_c0_g1~~TRINITY_DN18970_c0_g1_i2.p2  ORF type:complete len:189 (-),score=44.48 TRINITY_DN18970_c0_g1_i2:324-890(-)